MVFKDGSGLSPKNRVTAKAITRLAVAIQKDAGPLYQIQEMLPVSGVSGSLVDRMKGAMRGKVRAKVGYIPGLFSLAGFVDTKDGSHLAFSIFAHSEGGRKVSAKTKPAIDNLMSRFYNCGAGLTK
jgi:D-alanyl-D-alanine carboxypeptidase/D-alanyl-D-alanine-endopeptidase (penicillin-binding protein 4)